MPSTFASLKKSRSTAFNKLSEQLKNLDNAPRGDDNYWKLETDKAGNGQAIIRFLPPPAEEDHPFVRVFDHGFQGPGGWYIENSLTTIGKEDPVSEYNSKLWNSTTDDKSEARQQARTQKRRLSYHCNIYVVKDPANPQNEGKVFLWKFGKKVFDRLNLAMNPEFDGDEPLNPFDMWEGANFKVRVRKVDGWPNYDSSSFETPGVISGPDGKELSDEELEAIWKQERSLKEIIDPKNFKSYEELQAKLHRVLGIGGNNHASDRRVNEQETDFKPSFKSRDADDGDESPSPSLPDDAGDDDDDALEFFKKLAKAE